LLRPAVLIKVMQVTFVTSYLLQ